MMRSRSLSHIEDLQNRSPGPCYNPSDSETGAAIRKTLVAERQNELIPKGIEKETRRRLNTDIRKKEVEEYNKQIMDKVENDKEKLRRKLAQQEFKKQLAQEKNKAREQRVMQHKQEEVARLSSAKERLTREEQERATIVRRRKENHEESLLAKGMQRDLKLQEAAHQRAREKELLEKEFADKQSAEEDKTTRRLRAALAMRKSLPLNSSTGGTTCPSPLSTPYSQVSSASGSGGYPNMSVCRWTTQDLEEHSKRLVEKLESNKDQLRRRLSKEGYPYKKATQHLDEAQQVKSFETYSLTVASKLNESLRQKIPH